MSKEPNRNVYVGHRYVPLILEEWDKKISYEGLSVVTHKGNSYTSKKRVPVGIDILNKEFWSLTGNYNAQVDYYRQETERVAEDLLLKSDQTYVDTELGKKSDQTYVDTELGKKANQTYVDTELGKKANQTYVNTELGKKTDKSYTDTELGKKSDQTYVDTELGKKSDITYVDNQLTARDNMIEDNTDNLSNVTSNINSNFINAKYPPEDFQALSGNDTGDDAPKLQALIDYLEGIGGGEIYLPVGIYRFTSSIVMPLDCPILLKGAGNHSTKGTVILYRGIDNNSIIHVNSYTQIKDITIKTSGNYSNVKGIDGYGNALDIKPSRMIFENVSVTHCTIGYDLRYGYYNNFINCYGLYCDTGLRINNQVNSVTFSGCNFSNGEIGILFTEENPEQISFYRTCLEGNTKAGIKVDKACISISFDGVYCEGNYQTLVVNARANLNFKNFFINHDWVDYVINGNGNNSLGAIEINASNGLNFENIYFSADIPRDKLVIFGDLENEKLNSIKLNNIYPAHALATILTNVSNTNWQYGVINIGSSDVTKLESPYYSFNDSVETTIINDWLIPIGDGFEFDKRRPVAVFLKVVNPLTTTGEGYIRFGRNATANDILDHTLETDVGVGLTKLDHFPENTMYPNIYNYRLRSEGINTGKYQLTILFAN